MSAGTIVASRIEGQQFLQTVPCIAGNNWVDQLLFSNTGAAMTVQWFKSILLDAGPMIPNIYSIERR